MGSWQPKPFGGSCEARREAVVPGPTESVAGKGAGAGQLFRSTRRKSHTAYQPCDPGQVT